MKRKTRIITLFILTVLAILLTDCGGGGGGGGGVLLPASPAASGRTYTIGGVVSNVTGSGLVLQNNGADDLPIYANGWFFFATEAENGTSYNVTVKTHPSGPKQLCYVYSGSGTVSGKNVTDILVQCSTLPSSKAITAFLFTHPTATGSINESAKTIAVTMPYQTDVTALVATFATTGASVTIDGTEQVSGTTPNDFTNPVVYVVTAEDDSTATYTVTVTVLPRFSDHGNGTITDNSTGLMWVKAPGSVWDLLGDATTYCDNLTYAGYSDWRLPTISEFGDEFSGLINGWTGTSPANWLMAHGFQNIQGIYVSSSTTGPYVYFILMSSGSVMSNYASNTYGYVWPVRTGP